MLSDGNSLAFRNQKSDAVGDWCSRKGMQLAYLGITVASRNASEAPFPLTYVDARGVKFSWTLYDIRYSVYNVMLARKLTTLKLIFYSIKIY